MRATPGDPEFWTAYAASAVELSGGTMEIEIVVPHAEAAEAAGRMLPDGGPVSVRVAPGEWRQES